MTRMTGSDCAVMCDSINAHTHARAQTHTAASPLHAVRQKRPGRALAGTAADLLMVEQEDRTHPSRGRQAVSLARVDQGAEGLCINRFGKAKEIGRGVILGDEKQALAFANNLPPHSAQSERF